MAKSTTLSAKTLEGLGAERLAELLVELGESDAGVRKRLVLAAAEAGGAEAQIKAIDRRLKALEGSRGEVSWERAKAYAAELDGLRRAIAAGLSTLDPKTVADRLLRFIRTASSVYRRVDDSGDRFGAVFQAAVGDLGRAWAALKNPDAEALAAEAFRLIQGDHFDFCGDLVAQMAPALGDEGLGALARRMNAFITQAGDRTEGRRHWQAYEMRGVENLFRRQIGHLFGLSILAQRAVSWTTGDEPGASSAMGTRPSSELS